MAGIPVTIIGELYDNRLTIGGGPIIPTPQPPVVMPPIYYPPTQPPGYPSFPIWGPPGSNFPDKPGYPPVAQPPIYYPPVHPMPPIYYPPGIWGPPGPWPTPPIANVPGLPPTQNPPGWGLRPEHPIVLPPPPTEPPSEQPPAGSNWTWAWSPSAGWHPAYVPEGGKPQPPPIETPTPPTDPNAPVVNPLPT